MLTFLEWLQEQFIKKNEFAGLPITKDNCEDLFEVWLEKFDVNDIIDWGNFYGGYCKIWGQEKLANDFKESLL